MITSRQVNFDSLVVEGTARISVIYLDDRDKKLRCCDRDYPFRASVPFDGNNENCKLLAAAHVDYVNCRAVSQRKLDIHGAFTVHMTAVCRRENELITDVQGEGLRLRRESREISDLVCCAQTGFDLSEAIELSEGKPPVSSIIRSNAVLCVEEIQTIPGKLTVRGDAVFTMVYCTEQDDSPERLEYIIPFSQFFDIPGLDEECKTDVTLRCECINLHKKQCFLLLFYTFSGVVQQTAREDDVALTFGHLTVHLEGCSLCLVAYGDFVFADQLADIGDFQFVHLIDGVVIGFIDKGQRNNTGVDEVGKVDARKGFDDDSFDA